MPTSNNSASSLAQAKAPPPKAEKGSWSYLFNYYLPVEVLLSALHLLRFLVIISALFWSGPQILTILVGWNPNTSVVSLLPFRDWKLEVYQVLLGLGVGLPLLSWFDTFATRKLDWYRLRAEEVMEKVLPKVQYELEISRQEQISFKGELSRSQSQMAAIRHKLELAETLTHDLEDKVLDYKEELSKEKSFKQTIQTKLSQAERELSETKAELLKAKARAETAENRARREAHAVLSQALDELSHQAARLLDKPSQNSTNPASSAANRPKPIPTNSPEVEGKAKSALDRPPGTKNLI